jgi:hypothetical protein
MIVTDLKATRVAWSWEKKGLGSDRARHWPCERSALGAVLLASTGGELAQH